MAALVGVGPPRALENRPRRTDAEELARRLRATACLPGVSPVPAAWPCEPALLDWLREMTHPGLYTWTAEEILARRFVGGDIFGNRRPPSAPEFLTDVDLRAVPPNLVAPLLRRLSMTRPAPAAADLTVAALSGAAGRVSTCHRDERARRWGRPGPAPQLPSTTMVPHVVHGIWLGGALPPGNSFWTNYATAADTYAGEIDFVLWTDIPRERFDAARTHAEPEPDRDHPPAPVRDLLAWAVTHDIHLVNVAEVFHATAPMTLHHPYLLECGQLTPRAFAAASDHLRVEVVHRFGGLYADGDLHLAGCYSPSEVDGDVSDVDGRPSDVDNDSGYRLFRGRWAGPADADGPDRLPDLFDRVAASTAGFTLHAVADGIVLNDVIVAPARHPALSLWIEGARYNYLRGQRDLFRSDGGAPRWWGEPDSWTWAVTPSRSGRVHHWLLARLGLTGADLVKAAPAIRAHSELSWLPPVNGDPPVRCSGTDPLPTLRRCLDLLRWQHRSRSGDLYLTGVASHVRGLPDPDTGWTALLLAFADLSADLGPVVSVTDARRNQDGSTDSVELPAEARALLDLAGTDAGTWFLGERVTPAKLRAPRPESRELPTTPCP
jgi:hypothetical protein